jgi:hypothetical protein
VVQELDRNEATFADIRRNPAVLLAPKTYTGTLEYAFPALTTFKTRFPLGEILQVHVLYPETQPHKNLCLVFAKFNHPVFQAAVKGEHC